MALQKWALLLIVAALVGFCVPQLRKPAIEDEVLHHRCKLVWLDKGADWCELAHTPLYHEATSLWQRVVGRADPSTSWGVARLRSFSVLVSLLSFLVVFWIARSRKGPKDTLAAHPLWVCAIFALHPYYIQNSVMLDYDSSVLVAPLLLAVWWIERWSRSEGSSWGLTLKAGAALGVAIFAKELTPLIVMGLWVFWGTTRAISQRRTGRAGRYLAQPWVGSVVGLVVALTLLWIWGEIRGFHWYDPLRLTVDKFLHRPEGQKALPWQNWGVARFLFISYLPLVWLGTPLFTTTALLWRRDTLHKREPLSFMLLTGVSIYAAYTWLGQAGFYYPKYTPPAWPMLVLGISPFLRGPGRFSPIPIRSPLFFGVCLLFFVGASNILDPLILTDFRTFIGKRVLLRHAVALLLPATLLWWLHRRSSPTQKCVLVLMGLIAYSLGTDLRHARSRFETRLLYGEHGFQETLAAVSELQKKLGTPDKIVSYARDMAWALQERGVYFGPKELIGAREARTPPEKIWAGRILVSRSYGEFSVRGNPDALREVTALYPCHRWVDAPNQRWEWWWKPNVPGDCAR